MKTFILGILILLIIWFVWSWFIIKNIEEPTYTVLSDNSTYEVRQYDPYLIAETTVSGTYREALNKGFRNIADYIFGNNTSKEQIAMTAPVTERVESTSEEIAMTIPVLNQGTESERTIGFIMPSKYTLETIPSPNTDSVTLREVPTKKFAALKYTWYTNEERVSKKTDSLQERLLKDGIETIGQPISALYNPPLSFPLLLRNEILIEIK